MARKLVDKYPAAAIIKARYQITQCGEVYRFQDRFFSDRWLMRNLDQFVECTTEQQATYYLDYFPHYEV